MPVSRRRKLRRDRDDGYTHNGLVVGILFSALFLALLVSIIRIAGGPS